MKKIEIIQTLKEKCVCFLEKYENENNEKKIKVYSAILNILNDENAFNKIDAEVSFNILIDLGYNSKSATSIYNKLMTAN